MNDEEKSSAGATGNLKNKTDELRALKLPCTRAEFGLWNWAAGASEPKQNVTEFGQAAIRAAVKEVARALNERGRGIPQWVAEALREDPKK